jgi:hypothetical protein
LTAEAKVASDKSDKLTGVAAAAALIVLAAWLLLLVWLAFHTEANPQQWDRLNLVLGSLEAVAFAAAGALFGTTVQKQRVKESKEQAEKAESRAASAEHKAFANAQAAANGNALAAAVKVSAGTPTSIAVEEQSPHSGRKREPHDDLVALAERLFPG